MLVAYFRFSLQKEPAIYGGKNGKKIGTFILPQGSLMSVIPA
jgi:hypothetical protein